MTSLPLYQARLQADWIDYNGHLRDAYYGLVLSLAIDEVMDHLGLDAAYRERTHCTLYTVESHMHYMHEVKAGDELSVETSILDADGKRFLAGCRFLSGPQSHAVLVAAGESLLLHVYQGDKPATAQFPPSVFARLQNLKLTDAAGSAWGLRSRRIELQRRAPQ